jgi:hypothetical protein
LITSDLKRLLVDHEQYLTAGRLLACRNGIVVSTHFGGFMDWEKVPKFIAISVKALQLITDAQKTGSGDI